MARFYGKVGFALPSEPVNGIVSMEHIERPYHGDLTKNRNRYTQIGTEINSDITLDMTLSIVADPYAFKNFFGIKYVYFQGQPWSVTSVEINRPRLILEIGGLYNGETASSSS